MQGALNLKLYRNQTHEETSTKQTFTALYEDHRQQVYRYILGRIGNVQDANDVTAQTFLAAYENFDTYNQDAPFIGWLMGIARNKVYDHFRKQKTQTSLELVEPIPHPAPLPEAAVAQQLRREQVVRELQNLSEDRREVIALRLFSGFSNQEIAVIMSRTPQAIAVLVHRAIKDLQNRLNTGDDS